MNMDVAISSALEKFISDRPQPRPQRKLFDGAAVQRAPVTQTMNPQSTSVQVNAAAVASSAAIRGSSRTSPSSHLAIVAASPHHQQPPTRRRSPSPPKQPEVKLPEQVLSAEHSASSGQGCRHVLATLGGLPGGHGPAGQKQHGGVSSGALQWLTPRGHDISGVFKLLQRPSVRAVRHSTMVEEAHHDLLVTVVTEGGTISEDGKALVSEPLGLKWVYVYVSQHPRQGFLRVLKADRPVPSEVAGSHSYYRLLIPGTLVADYVKVELAADDPSRMVRIALIAFSQASTVTTRQRPIASPNRRDFEQDDEVSDDGQTSSTGADDVLNRTATPRRAQTTALDRSVLVNLSPPPCRRAGIQRSLRKS
jgi:hypothetical protein